MTNTTHIEQMIADLCPNGVEWKRLGEVCEMKRGSTITANQAEEGNIPVIAGGQKPAYFHNQSNREGKNITVAGSGAYAGYVAYWEQPIFVSDAFTVTPKDASLDIKFVYYFLTNIQDKIYHTKKGSGVPHVHPSSIAAFEIPIPPLAVQGRIVEVLDKFSALAAELQAELQLRRKQYEYYRTQLLTPHTDGNPAGDSTDDRNWGLQEQEPRHASRVRSDNNATIGGVGHYDNATLGGVGHNDNATLGGVGHDDNATLGGVAHNMPIPSVSYKYPYSQTWEWKTLGDVCEIIVGGEAPTNTSKGKEGNNIYPIYGNGREVYGYTDTYKIDRDAVAISSIGANTGAVFYHKAYFTPIIRLKVLLPKTDEVLSKYLYYACSLIDFNSKKSSVPNMSAADVKAKKIPLPPLSEQARIVAILDKFEALTTSLTDGIPAEQAAQQKRYEYYRDRLLQFTIHNS